MEQKEEFLVPVSNGYLYQHRVGEMGENEKKTSWQQQHAVDLTFKVWRTTCFIIFSNET